jgi:major intracellular serine protease
MSTQITDTPFKLPPFKVEHVMTTLSQSVDWGIKQLKVPSLWTQSEGEGITVIVIDTGCPAFKDKSGTYSVHPDLKDSILLNECRSFVPGEDMYDKNGHSTFCSGIIGAGNNDMGYVGIAPKCKIITYKALSDSGAGSFTSIENALKAAVDRRPDIVSMSLGATVGSPRMHMYIQMLEALNIPIICAGGNGGIDEGVNYPAKYEEPIAIGAYDKNLRIADFSAIGPEIDFALPGVDITSTYLKNGYATMSGTSFSTPTAAGVIALLISKHRKQQSAGGPNDCITNADVYEHLRKHSINVETPGDKNNAWGWGMLDVATMITDDSLTPIPKTSTLPVPWFRKILQRILSIFKGVTTR